MSVRITGISTPFGGAEWEYVDKQNNPIPELLVPQQKLKVFISSRRGDHGKYDRIRANLKKIIEDTNLATVYLFEEREASTLSAEDHYIWALEDSDVCIFLIDNADGVSPGVQKEIDTAKRYQIKSLYYFCAETTKEKTALEQSLICANNAKCKTVSHFDDLNHDGAQGLLDDIISIYHYYCKKKLTAVSFKTIDTLYTVNLSDDTSYPTSSVPKIIVENIDKCKNYIMKMIFGDYEHTPIDGIIKSSDIDEWGFHFLSVLFEGNSIKQFNLGMYLDVLKDQQEDSFFQIVNIRWKAIQSYFLGDIESCVSNLESALHMAKETKQPSWVIHDILIDLRNQQNVRSNINNVRNLLAPAQIELNNSPEQVYYPVLDRINESLQENYIKGFYKIKTGSPYSVIVFNSYDHYGDLLASAFIVPFFNGSLTHLLLLYDKIRDFIFFLCCQYHDRRFRFLLFKYALFLRSDSDIRGITDSYPEVLNGMCAADAKEVMEFCQISPIAYERISSQLLAFGAVGYYLDDSDYSFYEKRIVKLISDWLNDTCPNVIIGQSLFKGLNGCADRMSQNDLADICSTIFEKHYYRWFMDMFKFIKHHIDINAMDVTKAHNLIQHIINALASEKDLSEIKHAPGFLYVLRKQSTNFTNELDAKILETMPNFYTGTYLLETTLDKQKDYPAFIKKYTQDINDSNALQGKNGCYFGHGSRDLATVRNLLLDDIGIYDAIIMDDLIAAASDTLLISKENIDIKLDAVSLLICIANKYPKDYKRNENIFKTVIEKKDDIQDIDNTVLTSNVDKLALKIALALLNIAIGGDGFTDFLEGISYIQNDTATIISVTNTIIEYFESNDSISLPKEVELIVLQNVLQWLNFDYLDLKWNATRILFLLLRNKENENLINQKILQLVDTESVFTKNLILRRMIKTPGVSKKTQDYVISKCKQDPCYLVRKVCGLIETELASSAC